MVRKTDFYHRNREGESPRLLCLFSIMLCLPVNSASIKSNEGNMLHHTGRAVGLRECRKAEGTCELKPDEPTPYVMLQVSRTQLTYPITSA